MPDCTCSTAVYPHKVIIHRFIWRRNRLTTEMDQTIAFVTALLVLVGLVGAVGFFFLKTLKSEEAKQGPRTKETVQDDEVSGKPRHGITDRYNHFQLFSRFHVYQTFDYFPLSINGNLCRGRAAQERVAAEQLTG